MTKAVDVRITGFVQGVSFRFHTQQRARDLGVTGWVRNEPDGAVAAHLEGPAEAVDALVTWCHHGPAHAQVAGVSVRAAQPTGEQAFRVRA